MASPVFHSVLSTPAIPDITLSSLNLKPSEQQSWNSGGTAHMLPNERKKATFEVKQMTHILDGGEEATKRRHFIIGVGEKRVIGDDKYHMDRHQLMERHFQDFIGMHKKFALKGYRPKRDEFPWMSENAMNTGSLMPHYGLFLPTLLGQGSTEQMMQWAPRALTFQIIGSYAQTELGHGSNVRGLQTTAHYDKETQEFILNTPTLQSMKWWNSNLGCAATHALVYAQLILEGKEYGVHIFLLQVRDENHKPLPGIELGDCGPKLGDHAIDTGFMRLKDVRIPREHMLNKRQEVTPAGQYVKHKGDDEGSDDSKGEKSNAKDKMHYATMMAARAGMISMAGGKLAIGATIATRYSAVRHQGFVNTGKEASFRSQERAILDYQIQLYRVLKQVATAYCIKFAGQWMNKRFWEVTNNMDANADDLPEIHATAAGLKGLCTALAADGLEDCRRCCGGHGYLLTSGVAAVAADYVWQVTAEGDFVVMLLQTARYLMKSLETARKGGQLSGLTECLAPLRNPKFDPLRDAVPEPAKSHTAFFNLEYLESLFKWRSLVSIADAGDRLKEQLQQGKGFDDAWNACALTMRRTAISHCYYFLVSKFFAIVKETTEEACKKTLTRVAALFACANIVDGTQWAGLLDGKQVNFADVAMAELLKQLRPDAVALVDSFDIPDRVLNSALGRYDGNVYEHLYVSAKKSYLNQKVPFHGYETQLRPHLDLKLLALRNKKLPDNFDDLSQSDVAKIAAQGMKAKL